MIVNELLLGGSVHAVERVELSSEVTLELVASLNDLSHDGVTLLVGDSWSKRELGQVSSNSDTGGLDHSGALLIEGRALEGGSVHVGDVLSILLVGMVIFNDRVEELAESCVGVLRASVDTDAGVDVLAAREDALLERDTVLVLLVVVHVPDFLGEVLGTKRFVALGELRP